jgi:putative phage-type endonuclease
MNIEFPLCKKYFTLKISESSINILNQLKTEISNQNESTIHPTIQKIMNTKRIPEDSSEWHTMREITDDNTFRIGASDFASIIGWNPYKSKTQFTKEKTDNDHKKQIWKEACDWGHQFESEAADVLASLLQIAPEKCLIKNIGFIPHPTQPHLGATPDRLFRVLPILVEIKCPYRRNILPGKFTEDMNIYKLYYPQMQLQMNITGCTKCLFVQYMPPCFLYPGIFDIIEVEYNKEWTDTNLKIASGYIEDLLSNHNNYTQSKSNFLISPPNNFVSRYICSFRTHKKKIEN